MSSKPIAIVTAPYYQEIGLMLLAGAEGVLMAAGYDIDVIQVPGALEIPAAVSMAHASGRYIGFVALGCVIRGETTHYDTVSNESARGLMELSVRAQVPIGNGILTCENLEQARLRADVSQGDKGGEAAQACLRLIRLRQQFGLENA